VADSLLHNLDRRSLDAEHLADKRCETQADGGSATARS
jgi:hypothetical protein